MKEKYWSILSEKTICNSIAKYFLLRLLKKYGLIHVTKTRKELCEELRLPIRDISVALNRLMKCGVVCRAGQRQQGHQIYTYWVREDFIELASSCSKRPLLHLNHLENLLSKDLYIPYGEEAAAKRVECLTFSNRLLLMVLIAHANKDGLIKGLSQSRLAEMTGMGSARLRNQFEKLHRLGYLRHRISGGAGAWIYGKVKSVLMLNLRHQNFVLFEPAGFTLAYKYSFKAEVKREAEQVFELLENVKLGNDSNQNTSFEIVVRGHSSETNYLVGMPKESLALSQFVEDHHLKDYVLNCI